MVGEQLAGAFVAPAVLGKTMDQDDHGSYLSRGMPLTDELGADLGVRLGKSLACHGQNLNLVTSLGKSDQAMTLVGSMIRIPPACASDQEPGSGV